MPGTVAPPSLPWVSGRSCESETVPCCKGCIRSIEQYYFPVPTQLGCLRTLQTAVRRIRSADRSVAKEARSQRIPRARSDHSSAHSGLRTQPAFSLASSADRAWLLGVPSPPSWSPAPARHSGTSNPLPRVAGSAAGADLVPAWMAALGAIYYLWTELRLRLPMQRRKATHDRLLTQAHTICCSAAPRSG